jgi:hypothetical protein
MLVPVMDVRVMRMTMTKPLVFVHMSVGLRQQLRFEVVPMMLVVAVPVFMFHCFVNVRVGMLLRQVQPHTN